jgi:hypothetical protein
MKTSAIMFMPRNIQNRVRTYMMARSGRDRVVIPGSRRKL